MKKIHKYITVVVLSLLVIVLFKEYDTTNQSNNINLEYYLSMPAKDVNYTFENYSLYLPKEYEVKKIDGTNTYLLTNENIYFIFDKSLKDTTKIYEDENKLNYLYKYDKSINEIEYIINVWESQENKGYYNVYIEANSNQTLGLVPDQVTSEEIKEVIEIIKSIKQTNGV